MLELDRSLSPHDPVPLQNQKNKKMNDTILELDRIIVAGHVRDLGVHSREEPERHRHIKKPQTPSFSTPVQRLSNIGT